MREVTRMIELGKMERVMDLRSVWPDEEQDFSQWMAEEENLALLSDAVGINIELTETESSVGNFSVDLYGKERESERGVIIENQLEVTNHDHLGKIITYASGKDAKIVIWVVKRARDEHKQAVEWLNQHTDSDIGFFLLEIQLWQINGSISAPQFAVVERPNNWAKEIKLEKGLTETTKLERDYWQAMNDYAEAERTFPYATCSAPVRNTYSMRSTRNTHEFVQFTVDTEKKLISTVLYFANDKELFQMYLSHKEDMEQKLGSEIYFNEAEIDCRIWISKTADIASMDRDKWSELFDWYFEKGIAMEELTKKYY